MTRALSVSSIILLALLPAVALAAPAHKRHVRSGWHGYGFLPGYHQPPSNSIPVYSSKASIRGNRQYTAKYWYLGEWHYFGHPGFVRGRYDGGSLGPCWTWTPIGRMWNCG